MCLEGRGLEREERERERREKGEREMGEKEKQRINLLKKHLKRLAKSMKSSTACQT